MKKIVSFMCVVSLLLIGTGSVVAQQTTTGPKPAKGADKGKVTDNKKNPVSTEKTSSKKVVEKKETAKKPKPVVFDDFEEKDLSHWLAKAKEWKSSEIEGNYVQDANDALSISIEKDSEKDGKKIKGIVKNGKQSMKIAYEPSAGEKYAQIANRAPISDVTMNDHEGAAFYVYLEKGDCAVTVEFIDKKTNTVRFGSKPVELKFSDKLTAKKWQKITIYKKDLPDIKWEDGKNNEFWKDIQRIQFKFKGNFIIYIDTISFI